MLIFVPDDLKTKKCKKAVKKLLLPIMHLLDQYRTQEICDEVILDMGGMLRVFPDCSKNRKMYYKVVNNYAQILEFVPVCPYKVDSKEPFMLNYCLNRYKTQI